MKMKKCIMLANGVLLMALVSCDNAKKTTETEEEKPLRQINVPVFNGDSAYYFVDKQVKFGPRVPNTQAHRKAGDYLIGQFKKYGAAVKVQSFEAETFDHQRVQLRNIIASYNPSSQKRILIAAHWDTRPFADRDEVKKDAPFDGANDGGSGVGIILEMARLVGKSAPTVGVDFILFDGEDWGERDGMSKPPLPDGWVDWWCLGSQYWSKNKGNVSPYYGILLDLVGAKGSKFYREGTSLEFAPKIVEKVWNEAARLGYSNYFVKQNAGAITDDHRYINELGQVPTIDIVHYQPGLGYFGDYHHTTKDNMSIISKETLGVVGDVVMHVLYYEE
jgi:glutaminyl-peptide cyclotransferase